MVTTTNTPQIDFIQITKDAFIQHLETYFRYDGRTSERAYAKACALGTLLEKFGVTVAEIEEMETAVGEKIEAK